MGIYQISCAPNGANTGRGKCAARFLDIVGILFEKQNYEVELTQLTSSSFATSLEAGIIAGNVFPVMGLKNPTDNSVGVQTMEAGGYLIPIKNGEGRLDFELIDTFGYIENNLKKFNGGVWRAKLIDSVGQVLCIANATKLKGIALNQVFFSDSTLGAPSGEMQKEKLMITFDANSAFNDNTSVVQLAYPIIDIKGIVDVDVTVSGFTHGTGVGVITATVTEKGNANSKVSGLTKDSFKAIQGGATISATTATETSEGVYEITCTMDDDDFNASVVPFPSYLFEGVSTEYTVTPGS